MQGLKQKILAATSVEEVEKLLSTGKTYEFASNSTKNSWKNASRRVLAFLRNETVVAPIVVEQEQPTVPRKRRGNKKKLNPVVG